MDSDGFFRFISELHRNFAIRKSERWQIENENIWGNQSDNVSKIQ